MFYNTYRSTKSSMRSADKNNLAGVGRNIVNQRERLLNLQKRQKLKDLLITKFMQKYGIKNADEILEEEIGKFLQGEKLNDQDLRRLDNKIRNLRIIKMKGKYQIIQNKRVKKKIKIKKTKTNQKKN